MTYDLVTHYVGLRFAYMKFCPFPCVPCVVVKVVKSLIVVDFCYLCHCVASSTNFLLTLLTRSLASSFTEGLACLLSVMTWATSSKRLVSAPRFLNFCSTLPLVNRRFERTVVLLVSQYLFSVKQAVRGDFWACTVVLDVPLPRRRTGISPDTSPLVTVNGASFCPFAAV